MASGRRSATSARFINRRRIPICRPFRSPREQLRQYFLYLKNQKGFAAGSLKIAYSGIRFFYTHTVRRDWETLRNLRVPKQRKLPAVMSIAEVRQLLDTVQTPHNRAFFTTTYSLGLRLQEALHLQVGDIDSKRMLVHVHRGKGAKDRYVPLPVKTLDVLRQYWATHRNPTWLFPKTGKDHQQAPTAAHVHYVVPGGAIGQDGTKRPPSRADFFIPVTAALLIYRAKFCDEMRKAGLLNHIPASVWREAWVVHSQAAGDGRRSLEYLAPYVFRVAISDRRIVSIEDGPDGTGRVTVTYRRTGSNRWRTMTVSAKEFLRRFLLHVLPPASRKSDTTASPRRRIRPITTISVGSSRWRWDSSISWRLTKRRSRRSHRSSDVPDVAD